MKYFLKMLKIKRLKRKGRIWYKTYRYEADRYDCGLNLGVYVNPRMLRAMIEFNKIMDQLAIIDPETPEHRL